MPYDTRLQRWMFHLHKFSERRNMIDIVSETSKHRAKVLEYCAGNGLDLGSAGDPVVPTAIQVDLPLPGEMNVPVIAYCDRLDYRYPVQLRGDATNLWWFRDGCMDYVYSSHLLEDFLDWRPVLEEWHRVLKIGGYLIILVPCLARWAAAVANGQPPNLAHKHEGAVGEISAYMNRIAHYDVIHDDYADAVDYSILFVGRKRA